MKAICSASPAPDTAAIRARCRSATVANGRTALARSATQGAFSKTPPSTATNASRSAAFSAASSMLAWTIHSAPRARLYISHSFSPEASPRKLPIEEANGYRLQVGNGNMSLDGVEMFVADAAFRGKVAIAGQVPDKYSRTAFSIVNVDPDKAFGQ